MIYISSNNAQHPVTKTFTTLHYSSLNYTSLYFPTLVIPQTATHSLVFLKMGKIISRNVLS